MRKLLEQIAHFSIVGILAFLIDYSLLLLLTEVFGVHYLVSAAFSFLASVVFNYVMSVRFVFHARTDVPRWKQMAVFIALSAVGLGINHGMMWLLSERAAISYKLSKIAATAVVAAYNFISRKLFLERREGRG